MSTSEELIALHEARPFRPFNIHVADSRRFAVGHPEFLARSPDTSTLIYWHDGGRLEFLDLTLVAGLEQAERKAAAGKKKK